jgi:threonine/homoserine efflux transporter RhtA
MATMHATEWLLKFPSSIFAIVISVLPAFAGFTYGMNFLETLHGQSASVAIVSHVLKVIFSQISSTGYYNSHFISG